MKMSYNFFIIMHILHHRLSDPNTPRTLTCQINPPNISHNLPPLSIRTTSTPLHMISPLHSNIVTFHLLILLIVLNVDRVRVRVHDDGLLVVTVAQIGCQVGVQVFVFAGFGLSGHFGDEDTGSWSSKGI